MRLLTLKQKTAWHSPASRKKVRQAFAEKDSLLFRVLESRYESLVPLFRPASSRCVFGEVLYTRQKAHFGF